MNEFVFVCFAFPVNGKYTREEGEDMCKILKELDKLTPSLLLSKCGIEMIPPINLKKIIDEIGIYSYPFDFSEAEEKAGFDKGDIVGAALSKGERLTILYAKRLSDEEARVTIAHELAHCCLHAEDLKIAHLELKTAKIDKARDCEKEYDANRFAEELLVPAAALKYVCDMLLKPTVSVLADIFQVPIEVIKSRRSLFPQLNILDDTESVVDVMPEFGTVTGGA